MATGITCQAKSSTNRKFYQSMADKQPKINQYENIHQVHGKFAMQNAGQGRIE